MNYNQDAFPDSMTTGGEGLLDRHDVYDVLQFQCWLGLAEELGTIHRAGLGLAGLRLAVL